jgi:hypothetical protein
VVSSGRHSTTPVLQGIRDPLVLAGGAPPQTLSLFRAGPPSRPENNRATLSRRKSQRVTP